MNCIEFLLAANADAREKDHQTPSKRADNDSRALMPGKNKRVKETIAIMLRRKVQVLMPNKMIGESIESIILISGKERIEEMKEI